METRTKTKTKTGIEEMLGKLFGSQDMIDTMQRIDRVQSVVPVDVAISVASVTPKISSSQSSNRANNQPSNQANNRAIEQTNNQAVKQTIEQSTEQSSKQSSNQTIEQSTEQAIEQSNEQSATRCARSIWLPLNENQGKILMFLFEHGNGLTNMDSICSDTKIAYGTARVAIDILLKEGYMISKKRHNGHSFRGFEYGLNNHLCSLYVSRVRGEKIEQSIEQSSKQTIKQSIEQTNNQAVTVVSSLKDSTTNYFKDPELFYWKEKGINSKQVENWAEEWCMDVDQVLQGLKYCRFEMVAMNQEEERSIENPVNWFYRVMQRSGLYPKPAGYRSLLELRAEQAEQVARDAREARERLQQAERDLEFSKLLSDPESAAYQQLLARASDFSKEMGGTTLERELRTLYFG